MSVIAVKGRALTHARIKAGLSLRDLGKEVSLSAMTLSYYENGIRNPSPRVARRLCDFFKCEFDELFAIEYGGNSGEIA